MKRNVLTTLSALGLAAFGALTTTATAQDPTWQQQYRTNYNVPLGDAYSGRSPYFNPADSRAAAPRSATPAPAKVIMPGEANILVPCAEARHQLIHLKKRMPAQEVVGQEVMSEIEARTHDCAANVVITDWLPEGMTYVRSEPSAEVAGKTLIWRMPRVDKGQTMIMKVWLRADREGTFENCVSVAADPMACSKVVIGKATLAIDKSGPAEATLGSDVTYRVTVRNTGSAVAKNVVVTDTVPAGLKHASGQSTLTFNVGDLAPGASRDIPVTLNAGERGNFCNKASAVAANAPAVTDDACTIVRRHLLKITKTTSDRSLIIGQTATYSIAVMNQGDTTQTGVVVTDTAAHGTTIVEAVGGTVSGNVATWNVGNIEAGATKTLTVKIRSVQPGNLCNTAAVTSREGQRDSAQACTEWIGVTGVLVEVIDDPDPIPVGEKTTYTIRVTNQGSTRAIEECKIVAMFPAETDPLTASGSGTIAGKKVTFPTVMSIAPKASVSFTITAKGIAAGDSRMKVEVTTKYRTNPITEDESTTVY
jgi:uncharacterized repeat protein (TIGR01451 family)